MFYNILFLLGCYNLYRSVKSFIRENVIIVDGGIVDIPKSAYLSVGLTVLFYVMVMSICIIRFILF